jgi:hypothetical protein
VEPQIDSVARRRLAELARHLASGQITNFEFDDAIPSSKDRSVYTVYFNGLWPLYDDLRLHRMKGKWALTPEGRAWVARIILFLRSNQPYRYPVPTRLQAILAFPLTLATLGLSARLWRRYAWRHADTSVWPFYSKEEFEDARRNPVYLSGRASPNNRMQRSGLA